MKDFNKYFIVGTNSDALHDTMNGTVTGEIIRCKECKWWKFSGREYYCDEKDAMAEPCENDFCSRAERKETS
jgi:hypothetical protein